jgi:hypothetical protein
MYVKGKMRPVEITPGMGAGRDRGEWWRAEWIQLQYIARIFVNVTLYLQYNNNKSKILKRKHPTQKQGW